MKNVAPDIVIFDRELLAERDYWINRLSQVERKSGLGRDLTGPCRDLGEKDTVDAKLDGVLYQKLSRVTGGSPFLLYAILMATLKVCLHKRTGNDCVIVGSPGLKTDNNSDQPPNVLAIVDTIEDQDTFRHFLLRVRQTLLDAYGKQRYPFERLIDDLGIKNGDDRLFDVALVLNDIHLSLPEAGNDITLVFQTEPEHIAGRVVYNRHRFRRETIERFIQHFYCLLRAALENADSPIRDLSPLAESERHQLLIEWNDTQSDYRRDSCINELFERQAEQTPDAIAVVFDDEAVSYEQLNRRANQLAWCLQSLGVGAESPVGLCVDRSIEMVTGMLGVLKAGGAYVPLDASNPMERLAFMLEDSQAQILLTQAHLLDTLPASSPKIISLDRFNWSLGNLPLSNPLPSAFPLNLAYLIYTSGSTGLPKGVAVSHSSLLNLISWHNHAFSVSRSDHASQVASLSFDAAVWEIWPYLCSGACLHLPTEDVRTIPVRLIEWLDQQGVTISFLPTPLAEAVMREQWPATHSLERLLVGGDKLHRVEGGEEGYRLYNNYGPTENTVVTTYCEVRRGEGEEGEEPAIGRAIGNTEVYVVGRRGEGVGIGMEGELEIGGESLARGYVRRADLTAEKFIPDGRSGQAGRRVYRSGDVVRWRGKGEIEFVGRKDQQVKVRGYRIELGEIERALMGHGRVEEAVVEVREGEGGSKQLVGYVVVKEGGEIEGSELREYVRGRLPEYMVPVRYVEMEEMPLTANGKIDRRALPAPEHYRPDLGQAYVAPRTRTEEILVEVWSEVLGLEKVGIHDNFFELGGDSIRSIQVAAKAQEHGLSLPIELLFEHSTIEELAVLIGEPQQAGTQAGPVDPFSLIAEADRELVPNGVEDAYPLTRMQAGMVFHTEYSNNNSLYHNIVALQLKAPFDPEAMRDTIILMARRHPILRTSIDLTSFSEPLQLVHSSVEIPLLIEDLRHLADLRQEEEMSRVMEEEKWRQFDWRQPPLMRLRLFRLAEDRFQLMMTFHHSILDGWSDASLLTEVFHHYLFVLGSSSRDINPPPRLAFRDYVALERAALSSEECRQFWLDRLSDFSLASLPRWPSPHAVRTVRGKHTVLTGDVTKRLVGLSERLGVPLKSVLLAAHLRVLGWMTGQTDLLTGLISHGRPEGSDGERIFGLFLNTLPCRVRLRGGTWEQLIEQTWGVEREMLPHRRFPVAEIQHMLGGQKLFEAAFNFVHFHVYENMRGFEDSIELLRMQTIGETNLTLMVDVQYDAAASLLQLSLGGSGNELSEEQMEAMLGYYSQAISAIASDPRSRFDARSLLSDHQRHQILIDWNDTRTPCTDHDTIHYLFEQQARLTPDSIALADPNLQLSYREINQRANQLARYLIRKGVVTEEVVAILVPRSAGMVLGMLAILKTGGAYLGLESGYPQERLGYMLEDASVRVVLTEADQEERVRGRVEEVVRLDEEWEKIGQESEEEIGIEVVGENVAYVIYTSGTSGRPKGVMGLHKGAVNRMKWMWERVAWEEGEVSIQKTSVSFVDSVAEIWGGTVRGVRMEIIGEEEVRDVERLVEEVKRVGARRMVVVPSQMRGIQEEEERRGEEAGVRIWISSGEEMRGEEVRRMRRRGGRAEIINLYGMSEASADVTMEEVGGEEVGIGRPIRNLEVYVGEEVGIGIGGEIRVGGEGLARGYVRRADLTAERFVPDPYGEEAGGRVYKTGDQGCYKPDGRIKLIGRIDQQVKIRGMRVEIGEIEAALLQHASVREAVVVARDEEGGQKRLVAYVVADEGKAPTIGELRKHVSERLPAFMVPAAIISLDSLPMTASGKVNRLALPETDVAPLEAGSVLQSPRTPTEEMLASIWADILKLENVSIQDSFFDLGGHSLLATQVMSRVRQVFQVEVPLRRLFETPTIAELAEFIDLALLQSRGLPVLSIQPVSRLDPLPLSFSQHRLWFVEQLEPDSQVFIVARALLMRGRLRLAALEQSLNEVVRRHEILRTTIAVNQGQPVQVINPSSTLSIEVVDLKSTPRDEIERECKRLAGEESARRFDLRRGPLLRVRLLEVGTEEQVILLTMHHMVTDNWSTGVLIKELKRHYEAYIKGNRAELEELKIQYADYAVWQREWLKGEVLEEQAGYWKRQLAGAPPVLELPTDRPRPAERTFRCARESFMLPRDLSRGLSRLSQREGVTMFMTLLAALQTLLYRYTGQEDICIGSGIANRTRAEVEELIGYLVNIIVLRTDLGGNPRFDELLGRVREVTKGAYEHQELPFEQIVDLLQPERNLSYAPMAQVTFALQNAPMERLDLPDLSLEVIELDSQTVEYDISLLMSGNADGMGGLLIYNSDLFEASTIRRMIEHFQMILEEVVAEPQVRLLRIKLMHGEEELESEYSILSGDEAEHFTFGLQG